MRYLFLFLPFLIGCSSEVLGDRAINLYPEELETARREWEKVYGNGPSLSDIRVTTPVSEEDYVGLCPGGEQTDWGCYNPGQRLIVIRAAHAEQDRRIVAHEAMHALGILTFGPGGGNAPHSDPVIWGRDGILERVHAALGLPGDLE